MRLFALSDIHVDYEPNMAWVENLSRFDFSDDLLLLAGDISHKRQLLDRCLSAFTKRFRHVLFVPGNHDLWVIHEPPEMDSFKKFEVVQRIASDCGVTMKPLRIDQLLVIPLLGWYDFSFGKPGKTLTSAWTDFRACRWPESYQMADVTSRFLQMNDVPATLRDSVDTCITVSHFLPRIDLIPEFVAARHRILDPVLGCSALETQLRQLDPVIHVYGHSHINRSVHMDGILYVNNAFGYPQESRIAAKRLLCLDEVYSC